MTLQLLINGTDYTARWRLYESRWSSKAWLGESVQADFLLDDFDGAVNHDDLKPRKIVEVWEDASGSPVCLYHGRIANKTLGMGPPHYRIAMQWHVLTEDFNIELRGLRVESQTRGNETDDERFEFFRDGWLSGSGSANANARDSTDLGNAYIGVTPANAVDLDPEQYVDTFPADVFQRIAEMSGRQFFVYLEDDGTGELFYDNRGSQNIVADIDITDDGEADNADGVDVFAAYKTPNAGDHAGQEVYTGGAIRYGDAGAYYEDSDVGGSEAEYDKWETTWSNDWVENDSQASVILGRIITNHDETISYVATIDMRPEDAHRIKAGMWIPSVRLRRANKSGTDGIRAVVVTHEPVKPNEDGESWYRVTIEMGRPQFSGPMPRGRRRIPRAPTPPSPSACSRLYFVGAGSDLPGSAGWTGGTTDMSCQNLSATPSGSGGTANSWDAVNQAAASFGLVQGRITLSDAGLLAAVQSGGPFRVQTRIGIRHGIGINESAHREYLDGCIRVYRPGTASYIGTMLAVGDATSTTMALTDIAGTVSNRALVGTLDAVPSAAATDVLVVELGIQHDAPTTGGAGAHVSAYDNPAPDLPEDEFTTTDGRSWVQLCTPAGAEGDTTLPTVLPGDETAGSGTGTGGSGSTYVGPDHTHAHGLLADDGVHMHDADQIDGLDDTPDAEAGVYTVEPQTPHQARHYLMRDGTWRDPFISGLGTVTGGSPSTITDDTKYNAWPTVARLTENRILLAYTKGDTHHLDNTGKAVVKVGIEDGDGTVSWGSEITAYDHASLWSSAFGVARVSTGRVFLTLWRDDQSSAGTGEAGIIYSDDDGATWTDWIDLTNGFTQESYGAGPVVEMPDGDLLVTIEGSNSGQAIADRSSHTVRSTDGGLTWGGEVTVRNYVDDTRPYYESRLQLLDNDVLQCYHRTASNSPGTHYISESTDFGLTWAAPVAVFDGYGAPNVIQASTGTLFVVTRENTTADVIMFTSIDRGATWDAGTVLATMFEMEYGCPLEGLRTGEVYVAFGDQPTSSTSNADIDILTVIEDVTATTGVALSDDIPLVESGSGSAGTSDEASRSDHVHPAAAGSGGMPPPILLESGHAVPFTFDEVLQASDGSDWLYESE